MYYNYNNINNINNLNNKTNFLSYEGTISNIYNFDENGCTQIFEVVDNNNNITNFVVSRDTYFVNNLRAYIGMKIIVFYDASAPSVLIYPPRFNAEVIAELNGFNIKVDKFNRNLLSQDRSLQLNISDNTDIILENGQTFNGNLGNRNLIVIYRNSTRSIPAQTTPDTVIVMC